MPFEVQGAKADPTLDVVVDEVGTGRIRLTTYSGTVLIGPAHVAGLHMTVMGGGPATASMGFFVPEGRPLEPGGKQARARTRGPSGNTDGTVTSIAPSWAAAAMPTTDARYLP